MDCDVWLAWCVVCAWMGAPLRDIMALSGFLAMVTLYCRACQPPTLGYPPHSMQIPASVPSPSPAFLCMQGVRLTPRPTHLLCTLPCPPPRWLHQAASPAAAHPGRQPVQEEVLSAAALAGGRAALVDICGDTWGARCRRSATANNIHHLWYGTMVPYGTMVWYLVPWMGCMMPDE